MKRLFFVTLLFINLTAQEEEADKIITLFIENYPNNKRSFLDDNHIYQLCDDLKCYNLNLSPNIGLFATYMGYLSISDEIGQLTFPRKTVKESVNLLITPKIYPIFMFKNTIAYWEIPENTPAKMYKIEKEQDKEVGLYYWNITEKEVGKKRKVPLHTIVIFTDPEYMYVPLGITMATKNSQLILPTILAKKDPNYIQNALFILTIKPFFSKINKLFKERPLGYAVHITD